MAKYSEFSEIRRQFKAAESCLNKLGAVFNAKEKRVAWEAFLISWMSAFDKLIEYALSQNSTRPIGHKIRNEIYNQDLVLKYCRVCRNVTTHGVKPALAFLDSSTRILGNGIVVKGDSEVKIGRFTVDGILIGENIEINTSSGEPQRIKGLVSHDLVEHDFSDIALLDSISDDKGRVYHRPTNIDGVALAPNDFFQLGNCALLRLKNFIHDVDAAS